MHALPRLWRETDFRWLFLSQAISTTGDRLVLVALALLVTERTGSTTDLGIVVAAQTAALVTFLLIGGVWADRLPRHRIMVSTDLIRAALHALLAILILANTLELWQLVAIEVCFGAAEAFFRPAYSGLVPQTVPEELIQEANAANGFTQTLAEFAGPALATVLVLTLGTGAAFAIDAGTFVLSAALLALVRPRPRGARRTRTSLPAELRDGWREVRSRAWVWVTIAVFGCHLVLGFAPYVVLGPSVAADRYGDPALWGWVAASVGLGTASGALVALRWRPAFPLLSGILLTLPFGLVLLAFALGAPLALVLPCAVAAGVGLALFGVWWETALAQRIPPEALSRVASYDWMGSFALLPPGLVLIGVIADDVGPTTVMAVAGAAASLIVLLALLPRETRTLRRLEDGAEPLLRSGVTHGTSGDVVP
ncbi:MAG: MFS transporter [Actinobacteria bacterium]|nr:MFS transporter [Actinomycetota bacterium]